MADNAGAIDEHRALNYLAVRYPAVCATAADAHAHNASLAAVDVRPSRLSGVRKGPRMGKSIDPPPNIATRDDPPVRGPTIVGRDGYSRALRWST